MLECVIPILSVKDLSVSVDYYEKRLGFKQEWSQGHMASVARDNFSIYLAQGDQGHPGTWVWIGVEDVDVLFEEFKQSGATIRQAPTNYSWACEMRVEDPDGHVLRIGSGPKAGEPFND